MYLGWEGMATGANWTWELATRFMTVFVCPVSQDVLFIVPFPCVSKQLISDIYLSIFNISFQQ